MLWTVWAVKRDWMSFTFKKASLERWPLHRLRIWRDRATGLLGFSSLSSGLTLSQSTTAVCYLRTTPGSISASLPGVVHASLLVKTGSVEGPASTHILSLEMKRLLIRAYCRSPSFVCLKAEDLASWDIIKLTLIPNPKKQMNVVSPSQGRDPPPQEMCTLGEEVQTLLKFGSQISLWMC